MSLFINSMNAYVEISMAFVLKKKGKKARINELSKVIGYKVNIQTSITFL